jgi:hypothetical protein
MSPAAKNTSKIRHSLLTQFPRIHLLVAGLLTMSLILIIAISPGPETPAALSTITIPVPIVSTKAVNNLPITKRFELPNVNNLFAKSNLKTSETPQNEPEWKEFSVKTGDNLSSMFAQAGLNDRDLYELIDNNTTAKDLRNIVPGQKMAFLTDKRGKLQSLKYIKNLLESVSFNRHTHGFSGEIISLTPEVQQSFREGVITSSLFMAGKEAGLPNNLTMELANIFGFDIDFALDIRKGDGFKVMYEEQYLHGAKIGTGAILSAEFF